MAIFHSYVKLPEGTSSSQFFTPLIPLLLRARSEAALGPSTSSKTGATSELTFWPGFWKSRKPCAGTLKFDWCLFQPKHETTKRRKNRHPGTNCFMHRPCLALALSGNIGTVRQAHEQKLHYRAASLTNRPIMTCCFNPTYPHVW